MSFTEDQLADFQEAFLLFDNKGDGRIPVSILGVDADSPKSRPLTPGPVENIRPFNLKRIFSQILHELIFKMCLFPSKYLPLFGSNIAGLHHFLRFPIIAE